MKASEFFPVTKGAFGMFDSVEIIRAPQHEGNTISELWAAVAKVSQAVKLCDVCRQPYGKHSHDRAECPNPRNFGPLFLASRFVEMSCQAAEGSGENVRQCGRNCVVGTEFCSLHSQED